MTNRPAAAAKGFPIGLTVATAIAMVVLLALGTWQVQRLAWKRDLLDRLEALQAAPAEPLGPVLERLAAGDDVDFTRVTLSCAGLAAAPYVELYGLREGQAGVRLISACPVDAGPYRAILVDRGFIPDTVADRPPSGPSDAPLILTGVLRSPDAPSAFSPPNRDGRWFTRDPAGMAGALGAEAPAPIFLMAETATNPEWPALTPAPVPADISNRHLEYAVTWYGLAAALAGVYAAMLLKRRKS